jgi:RHS repeat-associated protein
MKIRFHPWVPRALALLVWLAGGPVLAESTASPASVNTFYGALTHSEPIAVPLFRGLEPSLRLTYSSAGGAGSAGLGWGLDGFSSIERAGPGRGTPRYDGGDVFLLDGQELVACTAGSPSPSCTTGGTHATRIESYQRLRYDAAANTWTVWRKDGTRQVYAPVFQAYRGGVYVGTYRWGLGSVVDTRGNTVSYGWWCDGSPAQECYPDTVSYNGTVVRFYREPRPDPATFANGSSTLGSIRYRIKSVDVTTGGSRVRAYRLTYSLSGATQRSVLASVQQFGADAALDATGTVLGGSALPPVSFSYDSVGLATAPAAPPPSGLWSRLWDGAAAGAGPNDGGARFGDFDGDGRQDILWMLWECTGWYGSDCQAHRELWLNKPTGWTPGAAPPTGGYFALHDGAGRMEGGLRVADVNGDGKSDLVWSLWECTGWYGSGCQAHRETWLSTGTGWVAGAPPAGGGYFTLNDGAGYGDGGLRLADVNGDGKSDLVWSLWECTGWYGNGCQAHRETWLSTGAGWTAGAPPAGGGYFALNDGAGYGDGGLRLADVNGDGKSDLVWSLWECTDWYGSGCQAHRETWLSTETSWTAGAPPPTGGYFTMWDGAGRGAGGLELVDLDGDGSDDVLWQLWECTGWYGSGCQGFREAARYTAGRNLLTSVTSSLGGKTSFGYTPSSAWSNTSLPVGAVLQTVSSVQSCDGRGSCSTTRYRYEGGLWSSSERRFLGFRKVTSVLDAAGNYTETYYHQHVGCISKPEVTYYKDAAGRIYRYSTFGYTESAAPPYTSLMTDRWEYECNLTGSCRRTLLQVGYDQYGNGYLTYEHGNYDVAGDERTSLRGLFPNPGAYIVGLPAYENIYAGIGTGGPLLKQTLHGYDNNTSYAAAPTVGLLTRQWFWNSQTGGYATRSFAYDAWGNRVRETDTRGATTTLTYDTTYRVYETGRCNALGQCSYKTWHPGRDLVSSERDLNGGVTLYAHDALGRPLQTSLPDGSWESYAYLDWGNPFQQRIRRATSDGTPDGLWEELYQDGLGRKYRAVKEGGLVRDTLYNDGSSRVWRQSAWYGPGEAPQYQVFAYDGLGRLRTVTNPDGTVGQRAYGNGYVITYDELGRERVVWEDAYGQMTQVREKNGASYQYTTYAYDLLGRLTRVTNAAGHATTATWDSLGRKLTGCDPDTGCTTYTYDDGGLMVSRRDARGQTLTFTYDALGRPLTKTHPDGRQDRWVYDEPGRGASRGALTTLVDPTGSESRTYDSAGRVTTVTKCVNALCYTLTSRYDAAGRLASVTYPDGEVVPYTYDASGRLQSVGGYVSRFSYNGRDQIVSAAYANGTTSSFSYSDARQWMTGASVSGPEGTLYQASYQYDAAGQVRSMASSTHALSNLGYTYDELGRLTGVSGAQSQTFGYDAVGNMTWNSQVGSYAYAAPGSRHAVSAAGGQGYTYDAVGNMLSGAGRTLAWDAESRLVRVTTASGTTTFAYDVSGQRVVKSGPGGTTYTFGSLVEYGPQGLTKYYHAGPLRVARRDATGAYWYHQDHLGSVRVLTNAVGRRVATYDYAAFGAPVASSASLTNSHGYGGHVTDETGLVYMNARYYDPRLGRFLSPDSLVPSADNPQALNRYTYVYNNPISNIDPTGHVPVVAAVFTAVSVGATVGFTSTAFIIATVGAATMTAGYVLKDPVLMSIGGVLLGAASGYAFGAGFLGAERTLQAAWVGGSVSALTSPISPLDSRVKQVIGWAYTLQNLFHEFKHIEETVDQGADRMQRLFEEDGVTSFVGKQQERLGLPMNSDQLELLNNPDSGVLAQRLYGRAMARLTGNRITAAQAMALDVSGGLVGPGSSWLTTVLDTALGWIPGMRVHAVLHDLGGELAYIAQVEPGYLYLGRNWLGMSFTNKLAGQVEGIFITSGRSFTSLLQRAW